MSFKRLLFYIAIIPIGLVLVSFIIFWMQVRPNKIIGKETPENYKLQYENVTITSFDGTKLDAWYIPAAKETKKAILLLHGYPMEKSDLLGNAFLYNANFNILLLDQRYFGKSEGRFFTFGKKEALDAKAALDFLENKGNDSLGIFGYSMGGTAAIITAGQDNRVKAVSVYAPYSDLKMLSDYQYQKLGLLNKPFSNLMLMWAKIFFGKLPTPLLEAEKIKVPMLVIHNPNDEIIPIIHSQKILKATKTNQNAQFYFPKNGGLHNEPPLDFEIKSNYFFKNNL